MEQQSYCKLVVAHSPTHYGSICWDLICNSLEFWMHCTDDSSYHLLRPQNRFLLNHIEPLVQNRGLLSVGSLCMSFLLNGHINEITIQNECELGFSGCCYEHNVHRRRDGLAEAYIWSKSSLVANHVVPSSRETGCLRENVGTEDLNQAGTQWDISAVLLLSSNRFFGDSFYAFSISMHSTMWCRCVRA